MLHLTHWLDFIVHIFLTYKHTCISQQLRIRVGIIPPVYPNQLLDDTQLGALQGTIMQAVDDIPEDGPIRFQGCSY